MITPIVVTLSALMCGVAAGYMMGHRPQELSPDLAKKIMAENDRLRVLVYRQFQAGASADEDDGEDGEDVETIRFGPAHRRKVLERKRLEAKEAAPAAGIVAMRD
jgi:hypothetical protein